MVARTLLSRGVLGKSFDARIKPEIEAQKEELVKLLWAMVGLDPEYNDNIVLPAAVQCTNGRIHMPLTQELTHCSWFWKDKKGTPLDANIVVPQLGTPEANTCWCQRCLISAAKFE